MLFSRTLRAHGALVRATFSTKTVAISSIHSSFRRRHVLVASYVRYNALSTSSTSSSRTTPPKESDDATAGSDTVHPVTIDLKSVGAEDAKVLTIADVLNARELEGATHKTLFDFEGWESIAGTETVHDVVLTMTQRHIGSLIVTEATEGIVGIVTERDIMKKISPRTILSEEVLVREIMSSHIMCIHPSTTVIDALATMTKENIRHLAVVSGDMASAVKRGSVQEEDMRCVLSITDIVRAYAECEALKKRVATTQKSGTLETEANKRKKAKTTEPTTSTTETAEADTKDTVADATVAASTTSSTPVVTAATLLKEKHKRVKLILNTRPEDNVTVAEAVEQMAKRNFGAVLVVDKEQRVLGIFTERDYIRKVLFELKDPTKLLVTDVMSSVDSVLQIEDPLEKCWNLAATSNCRHFPVIGVLRQDREKELAGILSIKDIVREISKDHHATPGFRLMEFLKSKMETKRVEPKPEQKTEPVSGPKAEASTETKLKVSFTPKGEDGSNVAAAKKKETPRLVSTDDAEPKSL